MIDTHAWVEYYLGTPQGLRAKRYIESGVAITPTIVLVEFTKWLLREVEAGRRLLHDLPYYTGYIETATLLSDLNADIAKRAGELDYNMKKRIKGWPIVDSVIYATAKYEDAELVTGDPHFKGLEGVEYLGD